LAAHGPRTVAAILVAAGSGQRLGAELPKAFVPVAGATLLEHATSRFGAHPGVGSVVVVAPGTYLDQAAALGGAVVVVAGGDTRQASVAAGLAAVGAEVELVLVHDVARPFVPDDVIDAVLAALRGGADAVIPVVPIHDTVRRVGADGALAGVVDRSALVAVQTPQGFRRSVLAAAHARAGQSAATDDAGLVEAMGGRVIAVPGAEESFKITTPLDLARAEAVARLRSAPNSSIPGGIS
jgi:2-C-methyl-D-erythritol 4-phosphate cytidylyltransferase